MDLLAVCIPSSFLACMRAAFVANFLGKELKDDEVYQEKQLLMDTIRDRIVAAQQEVLPQS